MICKDKTTSEIVEILDNEKNVRQLEVYYND